MSEGFYREQQKGLVDGRGHRSKRADWLEITDRQQEQQEDIQNSTIKLIQPSSSVYGFSLATLLSTQG